MRNLNRSQLCDYVNHNIRRFHDARIARLEKLSLKDILGRKNPYLFRAKHVVTAADLLSGIMDAFLSSSEEKLFGDFLEGLAIYVSQQTCGGQESSAEGLDLEFVRDDTRFLVSIKSGPNWGNSSQKRALRAAFARALSVQRQRGTGLRLEPVLGICYGRTRTCFNGHYTQYTGQNFWHFLSGDPLLYVEIIEPIGHDAKRHNDYFEEKRVALVNRLTKEFILAFCDESGNIDWPRLVEFNSGNLTARRVRNNPSLETN